MTGGKIKISKIQKNPSEDINSHFCIKIYDYFSISDQWADKWTDRRIDVTTDRMTDRKWHTNVGTPPKK